MSQEYTEDKQIKFVAMGSKRRLIEALLILVALFAVYLMVALLSFNPSDPSWSQTAWHEPIHNLAGIPGAWLADTLLFVFGVMAYAIPFVIIGLCLAALRYRKLSTAPDYFAIALRMIGALTLIITTCGLVAINADDVWYFSSGGVIGSLVNNAISGFVSQLVSILILLSLWAAGFTLYTGWSWLTIAEKIGALVMNTVTFVSHRGQARNHSDPDFNSGEDPLFSNATTEDSETSAGYAPVQTVQQENEIIDKPAQQQINVADSAEYVASVALNSFSSEPSTAAASPQQGGGEPYNAWNLSQTAQHNSYAAGAQPTQSQPRAEPVADNQPNDLRRHSSPDLAEPSQLGNQHPSASSNLSQPITEQHLADMKQPYHGGSQQPLTPVMPSSNPGHSSPASEPLPSQSTAGLNNQSAFAIAASMGKLSSSAATSGVITGAVDSANPQVKQGIGPELPRPNPVKIPSRRELASYGIKLPSQRQELTPASSVELEPALQEKQDALQQAALAAEFANLQQSRYGAIDHQYGAEDDNPVQPQVYPTGSGEFSTPQPQHLATTGNNDASSVSPSAFGAASVPNPLSAGSPLAEESASPAHPQTTGNDIAEVASSSAFGTSGEQKATESSAFHDSLLHPFLMRNDAPLEKPNTPLPTLDLLTAPPPEATPIDRFALEQTARLVEARLNDFRVKAEVVEISPGPVITRYELDLAPGVKAARISNLSRDLARSLSAVAVRVVEVIPGKPYVGLELPNQHRQTVYLREVLDCPAFRDDPSPLTVVLGKDISGEPVVADLAKMPHLLVAGTTGSGKSVGVNAMILSMLYKATPEEVRFIMIDPKMLELSVYEGIPHLLTEVVTDMKDAANALRWSVTEMERRYKLMSALGVRNLAGYNERVAQAEAMGRPIPDPFWKPSDSMDLSPPTLTKLPYIVVMVDEFADLMMAVGKKVEELIARLAQKARAAGIHLVLATQRPSVDVITGLIKANIPTRIAFTVSSKIDSRTILDQGGAESLLGMGDMLYMPPNSSMPVRVHGAFVRDQEVHAVVQDWKARGRPQYLENITSCEETESGAAGTESADELDPLFDQAVAFVVDKRRASISGVQRQFRIGYNRAARIIEQMEAQGIVSEPGHNGNREVLAPPSHSI